MDVEKQIVVIWAATNGYADDVAVGDVRKFEAELLRFLESGKSSLMATMREHCAVNRGKLDDNLQNELHAALKEFKDRFKAQATGAAS
jgi:F-type H+-transporting ATPase subunit alpha